MKRNYVVFMFIVVVLFSILFGINQPRVDKNGEMTYNDYVVVTNTVTITNDVISKRSCTDIEKCFDEMSFNVNILLHEISLKDDLIQSLKNENEELKKSNKALEEKIFNLLI